MAYSTFTLRQITQQFQIDIDERSDLFRPVPEVTLRPEFKAQLDELTPLALSVGSEKARSELIIAPVLLELWRMTGQRIGFFSGILFDVDKAQGLDGFCDYILTRTPRQVFIEAPIVMLVEARNENMKSGYGQCVAEMLGAQRFNSADGQESDTVYGAVTTGDRWKFLELEGTTARIDAADYYLEHIGKIIGILWHLLGTQCARAD